MRTGPDPDDPVPPAAPRVRPFLHGVSARPPAELEGADQGGTRPPGEHTTTLRPFVITAGRVAGVDPTIGMETQVTAVGTAISNRLSPEMRAIVSLCAKPLSVAEISARLHMHLGVTRILVGDLRAAGHLDVHVLASEFPDPETIMRVIRGLRAIS
ncbi:MAG: hypothetical protein QOE51_2872 [Actinoplanes sp.]|jgi:hypothetical protein|nr:hypothetical protein [Actinoplanes sp.]